MADDNWLDKYPIVRAAPSIDTEQKGGAAAADDEGILSGVARIAGGVVDAVGRGFSSGGDSLLDRATTYLFPNSGFAKVQQQHEQLRQQFQQEHPVLNAVGEIAGSIPTYAIGEGALRAAVPITQGGGIPGAVANLAGSAVRNAAVSGAQTAGMGGDPVTGAVTGAVLGPVADVVGQGAKMVGGAIKGTRGGLNVADAELGELARTKYQIPIDAADMANNQLYRTAADQSGKLPFSGATAANTAKIKAWQGGIATEMGEQGATEFTPTVLSRARDRIGQVFNGVAGRTSIGPAETATLKQDLDGVLHNAERLLTAGEVAPLEKQIADIKALIDTNNGTLDGATYQRLTNAKSLLSKLERQSSNAGDLAGDIRDHIDDAFARSAPQADQSALQQARYQYRVMRTVDQLAAKSRGGDISPDAFMEKVAAQSRKFDDPLQGMAYTGGGNLGELAKIGKLMRAAPQTGTADRAAVTALALSPGAIASYAMNPLYAASIPATLAANRGVGSYLRSGGLANRLIESTLRPQTPGTSMASPLVLPAANDLLRQYQQR